MEDQINKTIVVSYDDITRMKDFCTNNGEGVTRDFMDWYVNENSFFSKTGMLVCERVIKGSEKKFVVSFDFNNPDVPSFVMYDYVRQKPVCRYIMYREDNLAMKDVTIKISWIDLKFFSQPDSVFMSNETFEEVKKDYKEQESRFEADIKKMDKRQLKFQIKRMENRKNNHLAKTRQLEKELEKINVKIATFMAQQGVYFCYATMYYFAKNKSKEVVGTAKTDMIGEGKQVTALYKYTGYVNINEVKIYQPIIKKDGPVREYGRHIEKWSVRGHYRKVGDKTIWIEPFEKGEGELEKRIYGTEKEAGVNVIPKVFEVTRTQKPFKNPLQMGLEITEKPKLNPNLLGVESFELKYKPSESNINSTPARIMKTGFWSKIFSFFKLKLKIK